jgi:hypothetical protein
MDLPVGWEQFGAVLHILTNIEEYDRRYQHLDAMRREAVKQQQQAETATQAAQAMLAEVTARERAVEEAEALCVVRAAEVAARAIELDRG